MTEQELTQDVTATTDAQAAEVEQQGTELVDLAAI